MSQHRQSTESLTNSADSERFFELLLETAPDALIVTNRNGQITVANAQAEELFGYARDDLLGKPIEILVPERLTNAHVDVREQYLQDPRLRAMGAAKDLFGRRSDGAEFPVEVSLSPLKLRGEVFISSVIRDVSDRNNMERKLVAARKEAELANKANSAFLAAASHDLRQPVQALNLLNGVLRRIVSEPKALEVIDSQSQSLTAMTNLLNSLLDISRLDAGAVAPEFEDFPIRQLIDRLSAEFSREASQKGLKFEASSCDAIVRSDPNLLTEIIQNLVSNGIRYTINGSVEIRCTVEAEHCKIEIRDTGIGIDADQMDDIFKEFHQCKTVGATTEGFGLGLAIVRRLSDLLAHKIEVHSVPDEGSSFSVSVDVVAVRENAVGDSDAVPTKLSPVTGNEFVLLIEDDLAVATALKMLFEAEGYRIGLASSMDEAFAVVEHYTESPDLIVSDYHLFGEATGVDTINALREDQGRSIPAIVITGDTSNLVDDASRVSNCKILSKPVNPEDLLKLAIQTIRLGKTPN